MIKTNFQTGYWCWQQMQLSTNSSERAGFDHREID